MNSKLLLLLSIFLMTVSCAKIEFMEGADQITSKHLSLAIIPPIIHLAKCTDLANVTCMRRNNLETEDLYERLYGHILSKNSLNHYRLRIMTRKETMQKLISAQLNPRNIKDYEKMCAALEVDALLVSEFIVNKPCSSGASVMTGAVTSLLLNGLSITTATNK